MTWKSSNAAGSRQVSIQHSNDIILPLPLLPSHDSAFPYLALFIRRTPFEEQVRWPGSPKLMSSQLSYTKGIATPVENSREDSG